MCRAGLAAYPGYVSARVTLGRALAEKGDMDAGREELEAVVRAAPEHLAAHRSLAAVYHRCGLLTDALARYQIALALAPGDAGIREKVRALMLEAGNASMARDSARRTIAALEQWLVALHGIRASRRA